MINQNKGKWKEFYALILGRGFTVAELKLFEEACADAACDFDASLGLDSDAARNAASILAECAYEDGSRTQDGWDEAQRAAHTLLNRAYEDVAQYKWEDAQEQHHHHNSD